MNDNTQNKLVSLGITLAVHVLIVVLLILFGFPKITPQEESGILLMVGITDASAGQLASSQTPVIQPTQPTPEPAATPTPSAPTPDAPTPQLITSQQPDAPNIESAQEKEQRNEQSELEKQEEEKRRREAEEARKRREEEERRQREEAERQAREAQRINNLIAGAFSNNNAAGNSEQANGSQGNPAGNSQSGQTTGTPGWGSIDLGGRGLHGSLPRPTFNVNASGIVVVAIAVNENGVVTSADIGKGTTTSDPQLREAAKAAARKARFEIRQGVHVQYGTITYRFDSDN